MNTINKKQFSEKFKSYRDTFSTFNSNAENQINYEKWSTSPITQFDPLFYKMTGTEADLPIIYEQKPENVSSIVCNGFDKNNMVVSDINFDEFGKKHHIRFFNHSSNQKMVFLFTNNVQAFELSTIMEYHYEDTLRLIINYSSAKLRAKEFFYENNLISKIVLSQYSSKKIYKTDISLDYSGNEIINIVDNKGRYYLKDGKRDLY